MVIDADREMIKDYSKIGSKKIRKREEPYLKRKKCRLSNKRRRMENWKDKTL